jgi:putative membrane protein
MNAEPIGRHDRSRDGMVGLAVIAAGGLALSWACRRYPAELPAWAPWDFSWPEFLSAAVALWAYGRGLRRTPWWMRPAGRRRFAFALGIGLTYAVLQTRFDYLAQHMFTLTRVQHLVTHHLGPFLIALSQPGALLRRGLPPPLRRLAEAPALLRVVGALQQPVVAGVLFVGLIFLWLLPPVHLRAMLDHRLYALMNWSMVVDGLLFWTLVLDARPHPPARLSRGMRLLLVFAVQWPQIAGGALIGFSERSLYPAYTLCGRLFPAIAELTDQQVGASLIWFGGGMMSAVAAFLILRAMWAEEAAPPSRPTGTGRRGWDAAQNAPGRSSLS